MTERCQVTGNDCHALYKVGVLVLSCRNCVERSKTRQALTEVGGSGVTMKDSEGVCVY